LAAILAADVVGYSRMMHENEAGTLAQLKTHRIEVFDPRTAQHHGRIVKTMGDGVLVEFASAVNAVECAMDVQRALGRRNQDVPADTRIELRIGINLGDIIVDGDDIYGDGVNVAARLEGLCETGEVCVAAAVRDQVEGKITATFDDLGEHTVKNIDKPIRVYRVSPEAASVAAMAAREADRPLDRPAIAVLPFDNIGGDPDQEYFADGLTEDIIAALSLCRSIPVIARNSSFTYKGRAVKVQEVAAELGARYVLEGSLRRAGDRLRVTAQLIDAETGHHVWAERFDRRMEDVFAVQDEITERIAGIVAPELSKAELRRSASKRPDSLDAWECYVRGISAVYEGTREGNARAHELLQRAIELDPGYSKAHIALSYLHNRDSRLEFTGDPERSTGTALDSARRAIALDDSDSDAYTKLARALGQNGEFEAAVSAARKAVEINPYDAEARIIFGSMLTTHATPPDPEEGLRWMKEGLTLNPRDPRLYIWQSHMACAHLCLEQYEDAAELARAAMVERPDYTEAQLVRASALGFLGRSNEARVVFDDTGRAEITDIVERRRIWGQSMKDKVLDGLRAAGLTE
jgi:adenylate cyclase